MSQKRLFVLIQHTQPLLTPFILQQFQFQMTMRKQFLWLRPFLFSTEDADILRIFLKALKDLCKRNLETDIFMSNLAGNFYKAWVGVFPKHEKRQNCSCHVDKVWRGQLKSCLKCNNELPSNIYAYLQIIQMETEESKFRRMPQELFLVILKKNHMIFMTIS